MAFQIMGSSCGVARLYLRLPNQEAACVQGCNRKGDIEQRLQSSLVRSSTYSTA